jgi:hypothetical protein
LNILLRALKYKEGENLYRIGFSYSIVPAILTMGHCEIEQQSCRLCEGSLFNPANGGVRIWSLRDTQVIGWYEADER